ncbi:MAG: Asp-tRNA(Asn)/Glu-tRNA(Gln) amidotransferase subunit GatB [Candidatus Berkelbacteria bacterium]|nr:Asp-tRNA(Asn)/Glu-tRNA(Gln) amidotransferase subunit GatB [Candidatus Berkelbacteria bacterium]
MNYKTNIGLEIHVQLKTKSKMFCGCDNNAEGKEPNTVVCPICAGYPGVLPVANKQAIEWTIKTALALNCKIAKYSKFDRKHYFYPDLPKNYQISQYDLPFSNHGFLEIESGENPPAGGKKIHIRRVHLEEDAGKLLHPEGRDDSLVDLNRAGTPLMEVVTEPNITSPGEAKQFLQDLRIILRYLEVSDADMEKGHLRCDANISIRKENEKELGIPVEIKNMNSFKMVEKALVYEEKRQKELLEDKEKVERETRGWIDTKGITVSQRGKEEAPDYRYFPEPDLPPFKFSDKYIADLKNNLPELPAEREKRFIKELKINHKDAKNLVSDRLLADFYEEVIAQKADPQKAANWVLVEMLGRLNKKGLDITQNRILPTELAALIKKIESKEISGTIAKEIFEEMFESGKAVPDIIKEKGLKLLTDETSLNKIVQKIIQENFRVVCDYKKGKVAALQFLIGLVMRETKGQANPNTIKKLLEEKLR